MFCAKMGGKEEEREYRGTVQGGSLENGVFSAAVNGGAEDSVMGSGLP